MRRTLLIATATCAILASIPPIRLASSLALRAIACLSSSANAVDTWIKGDVTSKVTSIVKVALVALGLTGVILASPVLIIASIAADLALQVFEAGKGIWDGDGEKVIGHLSAVVIDSLVLGAIVAGSWQVMVAAAAVSAAVMIGMGLLAIAHVQHDENGLEVVETPILGISTRFVVIRKRC